MKYIALIPSYEPDERLIKIIDDLLANRFEVVLVNDGSNKSYDDVFNKINKKAHYLQYEDNHGKGYALKTGLKYIKENYKDCVVVTMDSDGQHTVKDALNLCNIVKDKDNTILLGKRIRSKNTPFKSRFGNGITRVFYRLSTGVSIYDTQTGLRAFKDNLIDFLLKIDGNRFEYEMNMLMMAPKSKIKLEEEVIETIYEDNNSGTHFHPIKDSYLVYKELLKFISSSTLSFLVDYGLYAIIVAISKSVVLSNVIARVISSTFNYTLNKKMVFKDKNNVSKSIFKYYLLAICILVVNTSILYLLVNVVGFNKYISKLIVEVVLFLISYRVQKKYIF